MMILGGNLLWCKTNKPLQGAKDKKINNYMLALTPVHHLVTDYFPIKAHSKCFVPYILGILPYKPSNSTAKVNRLIQCYFIRTSLNFFS